MAYTLGYIFADGCLQDLPKLRGKYISVISTDKETIRRLKNWMDSEHTIVPRKSTHPNGKMKYLLRIGNANLYKSLEKRGLYPNKSLTIRFPKVPSHMLRYFILGYFDGDGCIALEKIKRKSGKIRTKKLGAIFTSGSPLFLQDLSEQISFAIGIKTQKVLKTWTAYQLRYSTIDSETLFQFMYKKSHKNEFLKRKYDIFKEYLSMKKRPSGEVGQRDGLQNRYAPVRSRPGSLG